VLPSLFDFHKQTGGVAEVNANHLIIHGFVLMNTLFPTENTPERRDGPEGQNPIHQDHGTWRTIKQKLELQLEPDTFAKWIAPLKAKEVSANLLQIPMPNLLFYQEFLDSYLELIEAAKSALGLEEVSIRFEIEGDTVDLNEREPEVPTEDGSSCHTSDNQLKQQDNHSDERRPAVSRALTPKSNLNPQYTFDSFVKGPSNQFANATCQAVADNPGLTYNPLFIYGSTGLGKTHLLHAVGCKVLEHNPQAIVCYISSERFMNEMIYCIRFNKMWDFRRKYRNCDLFLVDDIQFISGKERTQEEFFHTFNTLYEAKKQIVITSDKFPQDISDIEDRLRNRFQWGLIADIQPPDVEHRIAILMTKADQLGIQLNESVAFYIANHAKRNVRELEGALHRIAAFAALQGRPIDMSLAAETFQNVLGEPPKRLTIETIQKTVADHFKVKVSDLKSKKRQRAVSIPRQVAMFLSRTRTNSSFPEIGSKFGGKDHTTVMHAVKKIDHDIAKDLDLKTHIEALERKLEQQS